MVIKNPKLGGSYRAFGSEGKSQDENDTDDAIIDLAAKGVTQNAYQTLKHSGTFDNKDNLGADRFTDVDGVNDTVDTGSSTMFYDSANDKYILGSTSNVGGTNMLYNPNSFSNTANAFDSDDITYASKNGGGTLGETFSSTFVSSIRIKGFTEITTSTNNGQTHTHTVELLTYDGSTWNTISVLYEDDHLVGSSTSTRSWDVTSLVNSNVEGIAVKTSHTGSNFATSMTETRIYSFEYSDGFLTSGTLLCNQNLPTLTGNEKSICVYSDEVNTVNTNITYNVSDGTTTISDLALNTVNGIDSLSSGQLTITFNLSTTDTSETPELYGYSYYIN